MIFEYLLNFFCFALMVQGKIIHMKNDHYIDKRVEKMVFSIDGFKLLDQDYSEMFTETQKPEVHKKMKRFYDFLNKSVDKKLKPEEIISKELKMNEKVRAWEPHEKNWHSSYDKVEEKPTNDFSGSKNKKRNDNETKEENLQLGNSLLPEYVEEIKNEIILEEEQAAAKDVVNCTSFTGFGLEALECVKKTPGPQKTYLILKLLAAWFAVASIFFFFLWCTKGWCCCCCPCQFCKVRDRLDTIHRYVALNPPGELNDKEERLVYEPTPKEVFYYEKISRVFMDI